MTISETERAEEAFEDAYFYAANQIALEAARGSASGEQARVYTETYGEVYDYLVKKHRTNQVTSG